VSEAATLPASRLKRLRQRLTPLLVVNLFYFGTLVYPVLRIWELLAGQLPGTPTLMAIMVGPLLGRLSYEFSPGLISRWLSSAALTWLGICFMGFPLVLSFELLRLLIPLAPFAWGLILAGGLAAIGLAAFVNAQQVRVRPVHIRAEQAPAGLKLVQISDVHVGSRSGRFLARVVRKVNALNADVIVITGDLIDFRDISSEELKSLATLNAPTWFIIGNHERYVDVEEICERLRGHGINVIRNGTARHQNIQFIGIDDAEPKSQVRRELRHLSPEPDAYRILLYHRPDGAEDAAAWGAHLMLCGHTHNGQIIPFNFIVRRVFPRIRGLYEVDGMTLYVSPGTGTWGPILRLGSRSEISLFTLGH
jgi:predicted MPP superfamily phosphohydrolase